MVTVTFHVPAEVKRAFNRAFARREQNAIVAKLMLDAIAREERLAPRRDALRRIASRRGKKVPVAAAQVRRARTLGRD